MKTINQLPLHWYCKELNKDVDDDKCLKCYIKHHYHKLGILRGKCVEKNKEVK